MRVSCLFHRHCRAVYTIALYWWNFFFLSNGDSTEKALRMFRALKNILRDAMTASILQKIIRKKCGNDTVERSPWKMRKTCFYRIIIGDTALLEGKDSALNSINNRNVRHVAAVLGELTATVIKILRKILALLHL